jgi:isocitrate/isopropylmalate dehydrogenase
MTAGVQLLRWLGRARKSAAAAAAGAAIDRAVAAALASPVRTPDLGGSASTRDLTDVVARHLGA